MRLLLLAVLVLVAVACSGGDTATSGMSSPTTTTTVSTSASPTTDPAAVPTTGQTTPTTSPATTTSTTTTTTTMVGTVVAGDTPVRDIIDSIGAEYQAVWDYYPDKPRGIVGPVEIDCDHTGNVGFGAVLLCEATPLEDRESDPGPFPITILVTGQDGSYEYRRDGTYGSQEGLEAAYRTVGEGRFCRDLVASEGYFSSYSGAVTYWFLEGRPDRMDADRDGIPCETVYSLSDIANVWNGTPSEAATEIYFGAVTEVAARGAGHELTIDYAFFLVGMEANLAAEAAGEIAPGEGVPNDYFILNQNPRLRTFTLADGLEPLLVGYREGIESIPVEPAIWKEMVAEAERCDAAGWPDDCGPLGGEDWSWMGSGWLPYWIQLDGDTVIRIEEQYLP
jgi:hypothetical protein